MDRAVVVVVEGAVDLQGPIQPLGFVAQLVVGDLLRVVGRRVAKEHEVVAPGPGTGRHAEVNHVIRRDVPVEVHPPGPFLVLANKGAVDGNGEGDTPGHEAIGGRVGAIAIIDQAAILEVELRNGRGVDVSDGSAVGHGARETRQGQARNADHVTDNGP